MRKWDLTNLYKDFGDAYQKDYNELESLSIILEGITEFKADALTTIENYLTAKERVTILATGIFAYPALAPINTLLLAEVPENPA